MDERLLGKAARKKISEQWPRIARFLGPTGLANYIDDDFSHWSRHAEDLTPAERAAAYEEWADFYEWRLKQRATELADDRCKRYLVAEWTDSMAYCCRRSAAWARGEDPGAWLPQQERRPDLYAESLAIVTETVPQLNMRQPTPIATTRGS
ncbi:putative YcjX-like family ATPase [Kibdelosporangium banguiense]|uniref:YcjX-like family ATPase n=1 Tax=Kibdelosporangium banguiense TaxID=1365924 RepID=A0ABS4TQU9_9PSEU|nr:hypothetical protein [Kibdelosporangium banguiense]MBP2326793.1 putative YcjX-like family ATPase [Kibdelosporangium banguiense]